MNEKNIGMTYKARFFGKKDNFFGRFHNVHCATRGASSIIILAFQNKMIIFNLILLSFNTIYNDT